MLRVTKAFTQYGRTEVKSSLVHYSSLAFGWTSSKPPAFFATHLVRWLSFRSNSNFIVLLSISNRRTQHQMPILRKCSTLHAILMKLPNDIKNIFFETLHGDISVFEFEKWLYADKSLEKYLTPDDYLDFISLNYKNSEAKYCLCKLIEKQISLGDYEKWRLLSLLSKALKRDNELPNILMTFYDLYCNGYSFFNNLGLGYGLAIEVPYSYGADNWNELPENKKKELIDSFYPDIETEIKKVIFWLESETVIPIGTRDDYYHFLYIDNRNEDEKIPTTYEVDSVEKKGISKKWWEFWRQ